MATQTKVSVKLLSNEALGEKLFSSNVTFNEAVKQFTKYYKLKQNVTDKQFIAARTKIYLRIAQIRHKRNVHAAITSK